MADEGEQMNNPENGKLFAGSPKESVSLMPEQDPLGYLVAHGILNPGETVMFETDSGLQPISSLSSSSNHIIQIVPEEKVTLDEMLLLKLSTTLQQIPEADEVLTSIFDYYTSPQSSERRDSGRTGRAISILEIGIRLIPLGHQDMPAIIHGLGTLYAREFERSGKPQALQLAVERHEQSVILCPAEHGDRPEFLRNLATSYVCRFEQLKNLVDIDKAVTRINEAISLVPRCYPEMPGFLCVLGSALTCRFQYLGNVNDIDNAIMHLDDAASLVSQTEGNIPMLLYWRGAAYCYRFERWLNPKDLDKATNCFIEAFHCTTEGDPRLPGRLSNVAAAYFDRFHLLGKQDDINAAINSLTQATKLLPDGYRPAFMFFENLGKLHGYRFVNRSPPDRDICDANNALISSRRAVAIVPEDHAGRCRTILSLGNTLFGQFENLGDIQSLDEAIDCFRESAHLETGPPSTRFQAAWAWAKALCIDSTVSPLVAYRYALDLVPGYVWIGKTVKQRYQQIKYINHLAIEAVSLAVEWEEYDTAVEFLEMGRLVVWRQILQLRTPMDELREADTALACRIEGIARELENASPTESTCQSMLAQSWLSAEESTQAQHRLAEEWDSLVSQARMIPKFHDFLAPTKIKDLKKAKSVGTIVVIDVFWGHRCDALVLLPDQESITHIHVPSFSKRKASELLCQLNICLANVGVRQRGERHPVYYPDTANASMETILATLWLDLVKPVLAALNYLVLTLFKDVQNNDVLPRVTWCATGALAFLPIHAAGCYNEGSLEQIYNYVVSSYTPSLQALIPPATKTPSPDFGMLAVGQAKTSGLSDIPGTVAELAFVERHSRGFHFTKLEGQNATVAAVLSAMEEHSCLHIACHASQNLSKPTTSAFYLHDGTLDLATITRKSRTHARLAFLSACETAMGDDRLPEEAVHLAAGMLMTGYPTVVATMWSIKDSDAPLIADDFYAQLVSENGFDHKRACRALHAAVRNLRNKVGVKSFVNWVPYIHMGI
ncbi:hypothetical protein FRC06_001549 [Ceratobasidium sp. 370]|nr:hypothetical protein FRC06_001549 [Ceratobasidium sp. 370]